MDLERVHEVVVGCFSAADFKRLLNHRLGINADQIVGNVGSKQLVDAVLEYVSQLGQLPILIAEIAEARPMRPDAQALFLEYALTLVSEAKRQKIDAKVSEAYVRFGLAPPIAMQLAGTDTGSVAATDRGLERTLREDLGYLDVALWRDMLFRLEGRVCRVELNDSQGTKGTGFLVGPDALLTNYHVLEKVIEGKHPPSAMRCRFDYKRLANGTTSDGLLVGLHGGQDWLLGHGKYSAAEKANTPDTAPPANGELDYALVRLESSLGRRSIAADGPQRGWIEIPAAPPALAGQPALFILQHPKGDPLKLAFDTQPKVELKHGGLRVRYATNTEGGSSGSPVFDKEWKLIALHHFGDPEFHHPRYNQGVPIGLIRASLGDRVLERLDGPSP